MTEYSNDNNNNKNLEVFRMFHTFDRTPVTGDWEEPRYFFYYLTVNYLREPGPSTTHDT